MVINDYFGYDSIGITWACMRNTKYKYKSKKSLIENIGHDGSVDTQQNLKNLILNF